jgi:hypothetical protein
MPPDAREGVHPTINAAMRTKRMRTKHGKLRTNPCSHQCGNASHINFLISRPFLLRRFFFFASAGPFDCSQRLESITAFS